MSSASIDDVWIWHLDAGCRNLRSAGTTFSMNVVDGEPLGSGKTNLIPSDCFQLLVDAESLLIFGEFLGRQCPVIANDFLRQSMHEIVDFAALGPHWAVDLEVSRRGVRIA